ncbi:MAG: CPXCG motif-containing cysteine-rich protein [Acidobacteriia bacterium]|nr:CPXCG motif-containing cysteine-rich protein [Terriglobia bacterium]
MHPPAIGKPAIIEVTQSPIANFQLKITSWFGHFSIGNWQSAIENEFVQAAFQCAGCGQRNETSVDESAGQSQSYIEDCQVCCKRNVLRLHYDRLEQVFVISADLE